MKSRKSRRIARAARQTGKAMKLGLSLAATARKAGDLGMGAGAVIGRRSPMIAAAMNSPAAALNPELARMGAEKAVAAVSVGMGMMPNLFAMQMAWMKFGMNQVRLAAMAFDGMVRAGSPLAAARAFAGAAERSIANGIDVAQSLSQSGRAMTDRAMKPLQKAVSANSKRLARAA